MCVCVCVCVCVWGSTAVKIWGTSGSLDYKVPHRRCGGKKMPMQTKMKREMFPKTAYRKENSLWDLFYSSLTEKRLKGKQIESSWEKCTNPRIMNESFFWIGLIRFLSSTHWLSDSAAHCREDYQQKLTCITVCAHKSIIDYFNGAFFWSYCYCMEKSDQHSLNLSFCVSQGNEGA